MTHCVARLAALAVLASLAGCHPLQKLHDVGGSCHDIQPYQRAGSVAPLKIPPGLDMPDTASALHIPELKAPPLPPRGKHSPCLDEPPPFKVPKPAAPAA